MPSQLPTVLLLDSDVATEAKCAAVNSVPDPLCTAAADSSAQPPEGGTPPPASRAGLTRPLPGCSTAILLLLLLLPGCTITAPTPAQQGADGKRQQKACAEHSAQVVRAYGMCQQHFAVALDSPRKAGTVVVASKPPGPE